MRFGGTSVGILMEAYKRIHSPVFDLRQMNKAFRKWTNGYKAIEKFNAACKAELESLHATRIRRHGGGDLRHPRHHRRHCKRVLLHCGGA